MKGRILVLLRKRRWLFLAIVLIAVSVGVYLISRPEVLKVIGIDIWAQEDLEYELVQKTTDSCWVTVRATEIPSESQLKAVVSEVWKNEKLPNIFLYLPEMNTSGAAYGVAKFIPQGLQEFRVNPSALSGTRWEE